MYMIRRIAQLLVGLWMFGASIGLMVRAGLGLPSWDVLHQGLAGQLGWPMGWVVIAVSVIVLAWWLPLRQAPVLATA